MAFRQHRKAYIVFFLKREKKFMSFSKCKVENRVVSWKSRCQPLNGKISKYIVRNLRIIVENSAFSGRKSTYSLKRYKKSI